MKFQNILCPVDFSDNGKKALECASVWAEEYGAKLHLLNVFQLTIVDSDPRVGAYPVALGLDTIREQLNKTFPTTDVALSRKLLVGDPASQIVTYADENSIDLIVMGTHGHTGLERVLMGSVAEYTVRHAHCPVVTIRTPWGTSKGRKKTLSATA